MMADEQPKPNGDVTKDWQATQDQKGKAKSLRIYAALCWLVAIGTEIAGIVMLKQGKFQSGNMALLIGLLVVIAAFAIGGSLMWKAANRHDPARREDAFRFFVQNQLGAIITLVAFLPLLILIFLDKDMDPKNKKIAGGVGVALALLATVIGIDFKPPSVEQYTEDMNQCAAQIKSGSRRKILPAIRRPSLTRPRARPTPTGSTRCSGSRPRTARKSHRPRTSSTSAPTSARCAARW
jgi:uncharacterized membrane protein